MIASSGVPIYASLEKAGISAPPTFTSYSLATEIADWVPIKAWIDNLSGAAGKYLNVSYVAKNWTNATAYTLESGDMLLSLNDSGTNLAYGIVLDSLFMSSPLTWTLKDVITGNPVSLLTGSSTSYRDMYILKMTKYSTGTSVKNIDLDSALMRTLAIKTTAGSTIKLSDFYGKSYRSFVTYTTPGTYSYTIPTGYSKMSFLIVGGGGGGKGTGTSTTISVAGGGGGGGAVYYRTGFPKESALSITAGQVLSIVVGSGGASGSSGTNTSIYNTSTSTMIGNVGGGGSGTAGCRAGATGGSCLSAYATPGGSGGTGGSVGSTNATYVRAGGGGGAGAVTMYGGYHITANNGSSVSTSGYGGRGAFQGDHWQYDQSFLIARYLGAGGGGGGAISGGQSCGSGSGSSGATGGAASSGTGGGGGGAGKSYCPCIARTYSGGAGGSGGVYLTLMNNY